MSRVLVTGGAGFVGSHLCERLLADGHDVTAVDNLKTGSERNVAHLVGSDRFRFLRGDVRDPIDLAVDRIFNLACPASPVHYQNDPIGTMLTSVVGMANLLDLARARGARILQASTSEVYGDPLEHPQRETYVGHVDPISTRACYDEGKRAAESLCFDALRTQGVDIRVVRIFNTHGPRMAFDDGRVVSNFAVQALLGRPLTLTGDGTATRSFQYVSDLVEGLVRMMDQDGFHGPVNLGNPDEITVLDLAHRILRLTGSTSPIQYFPRPDADPRQRCADITLARQRLGWEPVVGTDEGISRTVSWFKSALGSTPR